MCIDAYIVPSASTHRVGLPVIVCSQDVVCHCPQDLGILPMRTVRVCIGTHWENTKILLAVTYHVLTTHTDPDSNTVRTG